VALLITLSRPQPCCAFPMRARWKHLSMRIWCYPAMDARMRSVSAAQLHAWSFGNTGPGYRNEFHAGLQQASASGGLQRRVHLEVHAQCLRLRRACNTPIFSLSTGIIRRFRLCLARDVPRCMDSALILSPPRWPHVSFRRSPPEPEPLPRPAASRFASTTTKIQPDHAPAIPDRQAWSLGRRQLAYDRPGGWRGALRHRHHNPVDLSGLTNDQQPSRYYVQRRESYLTAGFQSCAPSQYSSSLSASPLRHGKRRQEPAAHRSAQSLRHHRRQDNLFTPTVTAQPRHNGHQCNQQVPLYNFLSTFSGTHYVTPRALTAKITLNF